ncbi:MAG TPA: DUF503 domain-containing protein [Syntrophomonadaceae bacterium]|nr:DUF503 domain-containing protein [Syntrophomonadaceae bacterium]
MFILYGSIEIHLPYSNSLKTKRKITSSILDRLKKRMNISISEVDYHDLWQRSVLGFAAVSSNYNDLEKFINYIDDTLFNYFSDIEVIDLKYDIIRASED